MTKPTLLVVFALLMIAIIVGVDVLFFREHPFGRLLVNMGIVLVFAGIYFAYLQ